MWLFALPKTRYATIQLDVLISELMENFLIPILILLLNVLFSVYKTDFIVCPFCRIFKYNHIYKRVDCHYCDRECFMAAWPMHVVIHKDLRKHFLEETNENIVKDTRLFFIKAKIITQLIIHFIETKKCKRLKNINLAFINSVAQKAKGTRFFFRSPFPSLLYVSTVWSYHKTILMYFLCLSLSCFYNSSLINMYDFRICILFSFYFFAHLYILQICVLYHSIKIRNSRFFVFCTAVKSLLLIFDFFAYL